MEVLYMLNELRDLSRSLIASGIQLTDWHPNFKKCPKARVTCFTYITDKGDINISIPDPSFDVRTIRKWEKANGCSFPAFNVPPLFKLIDNESIKKIYALKKVLQKGKPIESVTVNELINNSIINWDKTAFKKNNLCLSSAVAEIEEQLGIIPSEYSAISMLIERTKKIDIKEFHQNLKQQMLQSFNDNMSLNIIDMLFQTGETTKQIQLVFEINDWAAIGASYPANHSIVQKWMNDRFMHFSTARRKAGHIEKDAFNDSAIGCEAKLPSVRMSILGNVILRAMSNQSPCQSRYGMMDASSFPIGANVRQEMKASLEWLSDETRKGKTWVDLTKKVGDAAILFAYPAQKPETEPEIAGLMGGLDESAVDLDGATFSAIAARVTRTLRGVYTGAYENEVRIFVLAKRPGDARTKIVTSKRYMTEHTIKSAELWQAGCRNIPNIKIKQFEDKTPVWKACIDPFPTEAVWCLNTSWLRQGTYAEHIYGFSIDDALSLLLDEGNEAIRLSQRAINAIVRNCSSLILAIRQAHAFGKVFKINKKYEKQALLLPSILGLLLYKNGIEKGGFMNSPAYLVGRFLSFADDLHLKYCQHARKGSIPPQLVGNALMPTALAVPEKALSMLSQRILPYQAWAKTLSGDNKDVGLVKYFLKQIGEISNQLNETELSSTCSDTDKAQMLLGYLAFSEKSE